MLCRSLIVGGLGSEIYLLVHVFLSSKHNNLSAIVVSVHCLTIFFQVMSKKLSSDAADRTCLLHVRF